MNTFIVLSVVVFLLFFAILIYILYKKFYIMNNYPLTTYHFSVEWGGQRLGFTEVSGLDILIKAIEYREGASKEDQPQVLPGQYYFNNIVLKRGILKGDTEFADWINTKNNNTIERRDITIHLLGENHDAVVTWKVKNAFPVRYSGPSLRSDANEVAIEELELAHEGITVEST